MIDNIILILLIGGASTLAIYLQLIIRQLDKLNFVTVYCCVLLLVLSYASLYYDIKELFFFKSLNYFLGAIVLAVFFGYLATKLDRSIIRSYNRKLIRKRKGKKRQASSPSRSSGWSKSNRTLPSLPSLITVAILEELLFRGVLVQMCFESDCQLFRYCGLLGTTILFAAIHVQIGWINILAKLPLSILTLTVVLFSQSVTPAIIVHVIFNVWVWMDLRNQPIHNR